MKTQSRDRDILRRWLYDVLQSDDVPLVEKRERALELTREYLRAESGHIQVRNDDGTDTVLASVGNEEILPEGTTLDRSTTYCRRTVDQDSPLALSDASAQGWGDDPAYQEHGFDCYLGTPIYVDDEVYGTFCFVSQSVRAVKFTEAERILVESAARMLGREIEAARRDRRIASEQQARERSEDKYAALLQGAPNAIFIAEAATAEIVEANERAAALTGYDRDDLVGRSVFDLHPAEERERYAELFAGGIVEETRERFDDGSSLSIVRADGTAVPVEMSVSDIELDGDRLFQGIVRDISSVRERERELAHNRELLRQTEELANVGGWWYDPATDRLEWTDEVYRIHDLPVDTDVTVEEALEYYHPEDRSRIETAFDRLLAEEEPYDIKIRLVTAEDNVRWVRAMGTPQYDDGELIAVHGTFQDVTDRREREQRLRVRNRAIEEASVGITLADASDEELPLIDANREFERITGYDRAEALGRNCRFLQGPGTDEANLEPVRTALETEEPVRTELLNYRADGTPFWNELTLTPVRDDGGEEVTHFVGFQRDVTARKRRERLISMLNRVLRHNIRNRMTVIGGHAETIADRSGDDIGEMATAIVDAVTDLMGVSEKARTLEETLRDAEPLDQRDIVADVEATVEDLRAEYPDISFVVDTPEACTVVAAERLRLALRELGGNAARHSGASTVTFEVSVSESGDQEYVDITVRDQGVGLPDPEQNILETGQETALEHGSGIGLTLVNWIVTGVGGELSVAVENGTAVTIRLPSPPEDPTGDDLDRHRTTALSAHPVD